MFLRAVPAQGEQISLSMAPQHSLPYWFSLFLRIEAHMGVGGSVCMLLQAVPAQGEHISLSVALQH